MKLLQRLQTGMRVDTTHSSTCRYTQKNLYVQMKKSIFHLQTFITWWKIIFSSLHFNSVKSIFTMNKNIGVSEKNFKIFFSFCWKMWNFLMIIIFRSDFFDIKIKFTWFLIMHKKNESQTIFHHENIDHWKIVVSVVKGYIYYTYY